MSFFESLLALMLAAILLLQVSRRLGLPYPAMLALAGVGVAFVPGAPTILIDPHTALPLFIAPVLLDAAYDLPVGTAWKLWRPLFVLAVVSVLATAAVVAWIGWAFAGLPLAAAVVLGAIVAPPDAAAATAVLGSVSVPHRTVTVLKGESLFNDATALLLFAGALAVQAQGSFTGGVALQIGLAAPGGILLGIALAYVAKWLNRFVAGTLGGNLLQFVNVFLIWIIADRLHLSAVLAVVAFAMTIARDRTVQSSPRMRVHSFAVWATVVFLLNVFAFLLMGMQARTIVGRMEPARFQDALGIAGMTIAAVIVVRFVVVMGWNRLAVYSRLMRGDLEPPTTSQGLFVSWCGMRGLLSMATAFALPADFPQRDIVVLTAFAVVLATLVIQGMTLAPLIRWLKLDELEDGDRLLTKARIKLASAGLGMLEGQAGAEPDVLRSRYALEADPAAVKAWHRYRKMGLTAVAAERAKLEWMRETHELSDDSYYLLQEEIDWRQLALLPEDDRRIEES
ncbi:sodium:proton antiporter [Sphingosinicellaceae bacterium]|nr:sodium:proton antiporter [Sphingosinicellaceae bacterium]